MRKAFAVLALASVPLLLMLQVWQAFRYTLAADDAAALESAQLEQLERNKRMLAGIALYDSPQRVASIAEDDLGLVKPAPDDVIIVRFPDGKGGAP